MRLSLLVTAPEHETGVALVRVKEGAAEGEGGEGEGEGAPVEEEPVDKTTMRELVFREKGELESWRCILPSGTIVRYRNNGDAQVHLLILFLSH